MKLGGRYKLIGKKRFAMLELPYEKVLDTFEEALCNTNPGSRLLGSLDRETGVFKIEYKVTPGKNDTFETYCMLVQVKSKGDGTTKIEYAFVHDRLVSIYTKVLSVVCFAVPLAAASLVYFKFQLRELIHLALYIPLLLISAFGVFSLLGYKEKSADIKPMVKEFEELLINAFEE